MGGFSCTAMLRITKFICPGDARRNNVAVVFGERVLQRCAIKRGEDQVRASGRLEAARPTSQMGWFREEGCQTAAMYQPLSALGTRGTAIDNVFLLIHSWCLSKSTTPALSVSAGVGCYRSYPLSPLASRVRARPGCWACSAAARSASARAATSRSCAARISLLAA